MFNHVHLKNPGLTISSLPPDIFQAVMQEIKEVEVNPSGYARMNKTLAGQIEHEYQLKKSNHLLCPFVEAMAKSYAENWDYYPGHDFKAEDPWVNFQKKTEYNPLHNHTGKLSYVCWMQIPYRLQDEFELERSKHSNYNVASTFEFVYTTVIGKITKQKLDIDQDWAGRIIMFPNELAHTVYPFFTSDEHRISVAGNLV